MTTRAEVTARSRPRLRPHVRLRYDESRARWVVLAPERVLMPDDIAVAVLRRCDGQADVASIAEVLAAEYDAPVEEIQADVTTMLQDLSDKGFIEP